MSAENHGVKSILAALAANVGVAIAKFVAFLLTGSSSMLTESAHSAADSGNQILLLIGGKRSKEKPNARHNFGHGRRRYVYGFVVAILLFLVGGVFSIYEGIHKFLHPEPLDDWWIAALVLGIAILLEGFSFRTALKESNEARGKRSIFAFVRDTRKPELPVILLEDFGALVGLVFAVIGVGMSVLTGNGQWDGVGAMAIGTLLIVIAIFLGMEMSAMLVGESALPEEAQKIEEVLASSPGVVRVVSVKTIHTGPDELLVAARVEVAEWDRGKRIAADLDAAEAALMDALPNIKHVYLDVEASGKPAEQ